ncbi:alpha/beta fold hydrolase [Paenibacillus sp. GCM10023252]|uniref:alpha/beta fold hydrolase n=1 Tax=Paenibacillus sp. GCM10023252 TaxID=3252649 RepID=UPI00360D61A3
MGHIIEVEEKVKLFVQDVGEGLPVLFLHGWPVNHRMFEYQFELLQNQGYRCIGIDLRGFGRSDAPLSGYHYDRMADDVRAVVDALQLTDAVLVGFSMGGAIAVRYMARHQGYGVRKLALLGAAAPAFTQREGYPYGMTKDEVDALVHASRVDRPNMASDFGKQFLHQGASESFTRWFHGLALEATSWATVRSALALRDEDLQGDLREIRVPTAIMHGQLDLICPYEFAEQMQEHIRGSELIPFGQSGHGLMFDERNKFNEELLRFLK